MSERRRSGPGDPVRTPEQFPVLPLRDEREPDARVYELNAKVAKLEQAVKGLEDAGTEQRTTIARQGTKLEMIGDTVSGWKAALTVIWWIAGVVATGVIFLVIRLWGSAKVCPAFVRLIRLLF